MEPHATQAESESPRGGPLKFSYANGARPLAGYTIKRGIGRGGFGEVYFAVSDGGKEVAIKLIRHNLDVELRGVTHCLNLKHPNLIALYDVKQDEQGNSWVVMEYATGESLEEVIRRNPDGLPQEEAIDWMQGIAAGVGYLHDHGIVHRDLKPGNIFRDDGQVKLGDYGLSKFISCSRRSGQTESIGTVHYMAPEVANGRYGKEIDIYALGIILYEVLSGHVPFEGESVGEVLMKHLTAQPSLAEVPEPYREVIGRALAKDPELRFASVNEFMNALPPLAATMAYRPRLAETRAAGDAAAEYPAPEYPASPPPPPPGPVKPLVGAALAAAVVADEEPIWRAIRDGWRNARDSWDGLNTPTKVIVALLGCSALAYNATFFLQVGAPLVTLYVIYRIVRSVVLQHETQPHGTAGQTAARGASAQSQPRPSAGPQADRAPSPDASPSAGIQLTAYHRTAEPGAGTGGDWRKASARHWKRRSGKRWREQAVAALVVKSPRERVADLAGSMILAAAIGAVMSLVVVVLRGDTVEHEQYAWLTLVSVLGSWAILIPSKIWEGGPGDATLRRVTMLMIGLAVGGAAYLAAGALMIKFPDSPMRHVFNTRSFGTSFYDLKDGSPLLYAYLAYFGALFAGVRWWKQADPLRRTRLSVWSTGVVVFAAWLIHLIWPFPQPWGLMVAAITSISVQLVSPFASTQDRVAPGSSRE
jgi:hypothetical protein